MTALERYELVKGDINHGGLPPFSGEQMTRIRDAADDAIESLKVCGNCAHASIEMRIEGFGWGTHDIPSIECDCYFPGQEYPLEDNWADGNFSVCGLADHCHFTTDMWQGTP